MVMTLRLAALAVGVLALSGSRFHPIHAARIELDAPSAAAVTVVVHVYRDNFPPGTNLLAVTRYLDRTVNLTDARGARVLLHATGVTPEGDRLRVDLVGAPAAALSHGRIAVTLLQEYYPDQVNVVDARVLGHRAQLLFLKNDAAQVLPSWAALVRQDRGAVVFRSELHRPPLTESPRPDHRAAR
jgi:hypothetical protein